MVTHEGTRCSFTLFLQILIASNNVARESLFGNFLTNFISLKLELHYNSLYNICYLWPGAIKIVQNLENPYAALLYHLTIRNIHLNRRLTIYYLLTQEKRTCSPLSIIRGLDLITYYSSVSYIPCNQSIQFNLYYHKKKLKFILRKDWNHDVSAWWFYICWIFERFRWFSEALSSKSDNKLNIALEEAIEFSTPFPYLFMEQEGAPNNSSYIKIVWITSIGS